MGGAPARNRWHSRHSRRRGRAGIPGGAGIAAGNGGGGMIAGGGGDAGSGGGGMIAGGGIDAGSGGGGIILDLLQLAPLQLLAS